MSHTLLIQDRQRCCRIDRARLRRVLRSLLEECLKAERFELGFHLVGDEEMTRINEQYLRHSGSTDVITFDYGNTAEPGALCGEIFLCVSEAIAQAPRFGTTWQAELVRYAVHGLLHLQGYDDQTPKDRSRMKRREGSLLRTLKARFPIKALGRELKETPVDLHLKSHR